MTSTFEPGFADEGSQTLDGRFMLERRLGYDSIAEVWRATDRQLDRIVVIRCLHPHLRGEETVVSRFRLEALAAAQLITATSPTSSTWR